MLHFRWVLSDRPLAKPPSGHRLPTLSASNYRISLALPHKFQFLIATRLERITGLQSNLNFRNVVAESSDSPVVVVIVVLQLQLPEKCIDCA